MITTRELAILVKTLLDNKSTSKITTDSNNLTLTTEGKTISVRINNKTKATSTLLQR